MMPDYKEVVCFVRYLDEKMGHTNRLGNLVSITSIQSEVAILGVDGYVRGLPMAVCRHPTWHRNFTQLP